MKLKAFAVAGVAATAVTAFAASSASATTLSVGGVTKNSAVTIEASLASGSSIVLARTDGTLANTCTGSSLKATTGTFTGHTVTATTSNLTYFFCSRLFTVHKAGIVHLTYLSPGIARVVHSLGEWTISTAFGTVNCKTGEGTNFGTLTGVSSGNATMHINAVLNCGFLMPSATLKGTYTVTSPSGLGVSA